VALSDDQKAMLRLLSERGEESYGDMAALMGISVEEARERVKEALAEVAGSGTATPDAQEPQQQPPAAAPPPAPEPTPVVEQPPAPQPVSEPAPEPAAKAKKAPASNAPTVKRPSKLPGLKLPKDRGALIGLGAGALVLVIFAIVLIVSGGGESGSTDTTASAEGGSGGTTPAAAENPNLTQAVLSPVDGGDSSGTALFGRFKKNVLLQVTAEGLEPSVSGQSYAIWLSHSGNAMVPVGTAKVTDSGDLAARFQIPTAVLVLVARSAFNEIDVTRTTDTTLNAAIAKARKSKSESAYTGTDVMRGKITGPFVGAASKAKGE
jgi:outer membrane biosynthesis protein TonB